MKQAKLIASLQDVARAQWELMFPGVAIEVPLVIALPTGIHPYNKAFGYYCPEGLAIVLYQHLGREAIRQGATEDVINTVRHELIHAHQYQVQGYSKSSTLNVHRHKTWETGCYLASLQLWPEAGLTREMFSPFKSVRINGTPKKVSRHGALTDPQLHHWPRSMPDFLAGRVLVQETTQRHGTFVAMHTRKDTTKPGAIKQYPKPVKFWHPAPDDKGGMVGIYDPHTPSDPATWGDPNQQATVVPGGERPHALYGVPFAPWEDAPETAKGWNAVEGQNLDVQEPPLPTVEKGMHLAAGVVIQEQDRRIWTVSPSNKFGGYENTFPKGTLDPGMTPQAAAIKAAYEESGLKVEITGYVGDFKRSTSVTRYYLARRVGGDPAEMGWESQAVHLVPLKDLHAHAYHHNDQKLVAAVQQKLIEG